jgi:hypothetical protein|tara:strand:- start:154 stop:357 length:204 start_codon:yes stop_codon:yes gene_type:complete
MSIPVSAMHAAVRDNYLGLAEKQIESDDGYQHKIAGRDAVRLAYILSEEAGNDDQWDAAVTAYRSGE